MPDCAIIGTGPAGLSAAINLKLHEKELLWFGSASLSEKIHKAERVANYPGLPMVTGPELARRFQEHAALMGLAPTEKMVSQIMPSGGGFMLLADNEVYQARTVILATGVVPARLLPGEEALLGRGVSYCATCDGFLYRGKTLAVVCASPRQEHEAAYLAGLAERVYLFAGYPGAELKSENVILMQQKPAGISGEQRAESVLLNDGTALAVDGVFILRDAIAPAALLPALEVEKGRIVTARDMATNIPGCFACGDCAGAPYQFAKAVGEGNIAAHSVLRRLAAMERNAEK